MPRISAFYGITIAMFWNEGHHARPHFHARHAGRAASITFDGEVLAGELPKRALMLVGERARLHPDELAENWEQARREEALLEIDPLPYDERMPELVDITAVEVIGEYRLRLTFADGTVGDVDFQAREWGGVLEPLRDPEYFARVTVDPELGTIAWPDGADMAPEPLYDEARRHLANAAQPSAPAVRERAR